VGPVLFGVPQRSSFGPVSLHSLHVWYLLPIAVLWPPAPYVCWWQAWHVVVLLMQWPQLGWYCLPLMSFLDGWPQIVWSWIHPNPVHLAWWLLTVVWCLPTFADWQMGPLPGLEEIPMQMSLGVWCSRANSVIRGPCFVQVITLLKFCLAVPLLN